MLTQAKSIIGIVVLGAILKTCFAGEFQCQGKQLTLNTTQIEQTKECLGYHGAESIWKLPSKDFPCFGTCLFKSRGFFSDDGEEIVLERMMTHIGKVLDEKEAKPMAEGMKKCISDYGKNLGTKTDKTCMKFMKFGQCLHDTVMDVCI